MRQDINLHDLASAPEVVLDYLDDDAAFINDVKFLTEEQISARLKMGTLAYCIRGRAQCILNGLPLEFHENQILICPSYTTMSDMLFSADFEFRALFFTDRLLQSLLREKISVWNEVVYQHRKYVVDLPPEGKVSYGHFFEMLYPYTEQKRDIPFRVEIVQSLLRAAFLGLCSLLKQNLYEPSFTSEQTSRDVSAFSSSQHLFQRFLSILTHTEVKHHSTQYYADLLCVSSKYLSSVCRQVSGKTASQWINEFTLEDIRYQLLSTDHTLKEIANTLGFPSLSFFGKYVKQHFGFSPMAFRHQSFLKSDTGC